MTGEPLLSVAGLTVRIATLERGFDAVMDVSFAVRPGETFAIVGESGSGKSLTALAVMGLLPENAARLTAGAIRLQGEDIAAASEHRRAEIRGNRIAMVFQEPMTSLNPSMRVGQQVARRSRQPHSSMLGAGNLEKAWAAWVPDAARKRFCAA